MNIFLDYKKKFLVFLKKLQKNKIISIPDNLEGLIVELPPKNNQAHLSSNAAMIIAKFNKKNPLDIANILRENLLTDFKEFEKIDVAKPGFLNINLKKDFWENYLLKVIALNFDYGSNKKSIKKYNIEFVSANPTGPLHVGHCRGAILGDVLCSLLKFNGHTITKEYYVNDHGNQIKIFALSVYYRILQIIEKKNFPTDKGLYPGNYIIDIAQKIVDENKIKDFKNFENIHNELIKVALVHSMNIIKKNLKLLGVNHDIFVYESELIEKGLVSKTIENLKKDKFVYFGQLEAPKGEIQKNWKKRKQLLFNSTKFGDDTDRALQKEDETWTYFASDIAYHAHKIKRDFDFLINILGSDHAGYIKRITAAVKAISNNKTNLVCKVSQLVKLYKKGVPFKMSKRKGDYITVEDLISEVGKDSVRFMMLNRNSDVELDFDFAKVTEKSKDNPVFYVQYAYARINSIFRVLNLELDSVIDLEGEKFILNKNELEILKKISEWPNCVEVSCSKFEPHRIPYYLYDLVTLFHSYWNLGKEKKDFRFISDGKPTSKSKLILLQALSIVIKNAMDILGVSTPKSM